MQVVPVAHRVVVAVALAVLGVSGVADGEDAKKRISKRGKAGQVLRIDVKRKMVWINLGSANNLPRRTTFGVYARPAGPGFLKKERKGSVVVTRVLGPHFSEARILKQDADRPFAIGDRTHTPLWSPGDAVNCALVGLFDIDGDGTSDRKLIHDLITNAGGEIISEVDDQGRRTGRSLTAKTRFLVFGTMPDPKATKDPKQREIAKRIGKHASNMRAEARKHGVRVVMLKDLLSYK